MRTIRASMSVLAVTALTSAILLLQGGVASAHEARTVGHIDMEVGFGSEPTYVGLPNSAEIILHDANTGKPILDASHTLKVTVKFGSQSKDLTVEPNFDLGFPGDYRGYFVPTQPGPYTFILSGSIDGVKMKDQSFTSAPNTFSSAVDLTSAAFPAAQIPSATDLATRITQDDARSKTALDAASAAATAAKDSASSAKTVALIALVVGIVGIAVGAAGLASASRARRG
jgi:hypothetical protein